MYMWVVWRRGGKMWICDFGASKSDMETVDMQSRSAFWYLLIIRVSGEMKHEDKKVNRSALLSCAVFGQVFPPPSSPPYSPCFLSIKRANTKETPNE